LQRGEALLPKELGTSFILITVLTWLSLAHAVCLKCLGCLYETSNCSSERRRKKEEEEKEDKNRFPFIFSVLGTSLHSFIFVANLNGFKNKAWWYMPIILVLKRLKQEDCEFKSSLGDIARPC
jgi:hypothetical protein